jgi:hypothetical protein
MKLHHYLFHLLVFTACDKAGDSAVAPGGNTSGVGGSMARFALLGDKLYTVDNQSLRVFDVSNPANPTYADKQSLGFGIETIFPYRGNLFIGTQTGMQIYSAANPARPQFLATFTHVTACDPVVVQGNYAYVTLRSGTACNRGQNRLDVVDVSNLSRPQLVGSFPMLNPHGLGVDGLDLFVTEGTFGLKVFDLTDPKVPKQTQVFPDVKSFDVIPLNKVLMVTGEEGLRQYDYADRSQLKLLSHLPIEP